QDLGRCLTQSVEDRIILAIDERPGPRLCDGDFMLLAYRLGVEWGDATVRQEYVLILDRVPLVALVEHGISPLTSRKRKRRVCPTVAYASGSYLSPSTILSAP